MEMAAIDILTTVDEILLMKDEPNWGALGILLSFGFFSISRRFFQTIIPQEVQLQGEFTSWKWVNISNSLLHSIITGLGSMFGFLIWPKLAYDVFHSYSWFSHLLCCVAVGYFLLDLIDMLIYNQNRTSTYELVLHHLFAGSCFCISALTRYYLGFAMVALIIENNSIFLHWRQLLIIQDLPKSKTYYRVISLTNLVTFVGFRVVSLGWMTRYLVLNRKFVPQPDYTCGCVADIGVVIMSTILFYRLLKADLPCFVSQVKLVVEPVVQEEKNRKQKSDGENNHID